MSAHAPVTPVHKEHPHSSLLQSHKELSSRFFTSKRCKKFKPATPAGPAEGEKKKPRPCTGLLQGRGERGCVKSASFSGRTSPGERVLPAQKRERAEEQACKCTLGAGGGSAALGPCVCTALLSSSPVGLVFHPCALRGKRQPDRGSQAPSVVMGQAHEPKPGPQSM